MEPDYSYRFTITDGVKLMHLHCKIFHAKWDHSRDCLKRIYMLIVAMPIILTYQNNQSGLVKHSHRHDNSLAAPMQCFADKIKSRGSSLGKERPWKTILNSKMGLSKHCKTRQVSCWFMHIRRTLHNIIIYDIWKYMNIFEYIRTKKMCSHPCYLPSSDYWLACRNLRPVKILKFGACMFVTWAISFLYRQNSNDWYIRNNILDFWFYFPQKR